MFETQTLHRHNNKSQSEFEDYEGFVEKFKRKASTDECCTPPAVYDAILDWVKTNIDITNMDIIRPFYPDTDYKQFDYKPNTVVIDNPPFSILTGIIDYYIAHNVQFFLFAPHLTVCQAARRKDVTAIITDVRITYENGAEVNTAFVTNMTPDWKIIASPSLTKAIKEAQPPKYNIYAKKNQYPNEFISVSRVARLLNKGVDFSLKAEDAVYTKSVGNYKCFGGGFITSTDIGNDFYKKEQEAAVLNEQNFVREWNEQQKEVIKQLNEKKKCLTI